MNTRVITTVEGERFIHKELWRVVLRQLEHAKKMPSGAFYDDLVAMTFAFHALEAYLNYVGEKLAPEIWKDERNYFLKQPYRGFDGKIRKVFELTGLSEPKRDTRPYSSVWMLKGLRDLMAHGKVERITDDFEHDAEEQSPWVRTPLDFLVTEANAEIARNDVASITKSIHDAARPKVDDVWFQSAGPFEGVLQHNEGSSRIAT